MELSFPVPIHAQIPSLGLGLLWTWEWHVYKLLVVVHFWYLRYGKHVRLSLIKEQLFRDWNLKQFSFNISTLLLIQTNHQYTWLLEIEKKLPDILWKSDKIHGCQSWNIMQNGLKLYFTQNYMTRQCKIIVLKCFFLTDERGEARISINSDYSKDGEMHQNKGSWSEGLHHTG